MRNRQGGFTLLSVILAMAITAIVSALAIGRSLVAVEEALAEGSGAYLAEVAGATEQFLFQHWYEYANGLDVPAAADDLRPTIEELVVNGKRLLPSFPTTLPTRQSVEIFITRTNCPGEDCLVTALTCTSTPVTMGRSDVRFDLASIMMTSQHGIGGQSRFSDPSHIVGPALNVDNPYGDVAGIVCASARVDTALMMQFVRMGDTRNPYLRGDLTVKGDVSAGGDSGTCARAILGADGSIRSRRDDCTDAVVVQPEQARVSAFDASGSARVLVDGDQGRVSANFVRPTTAVAANTNCSGSLEGDVGVDADVRFGLVVCRAGTWRRVGLEPAASGAPCSTDGAIGQDANGVAFVCRGGTWQSVTGRLPRSVPHQRYLVGNGTSVPIPTDCPANSVPAILIRSIDGVMDNTSSPSRNRFAHYAQKSGNNWIVRLLVFDPSGNSYSSAANGTPYDMRAIAEVNCDFND